MQENRPKEQKKHPPKEKGSENAAFLACIGMKNLFT